MKLMKEDKKDNNQQFIVSHPGHSVACVVRESSFIIRLFAYWQVQSYHETLLLLLPFSEPRLY